MAPLSLLGVSRGVVSDRLFIPFRSFIPSLVYGAFETGKEKALEKNLGEMNVCTVSVLQKLN